MFWNVSAHRFYISNKIIVSSRGMGKFWWHPRHYWTRIHLPLFFITIRRYIRAWGKQGPSENVSRAWSRSNIFGTRSKGFDRYSKGLTRTRGTSFSPPGARKRSLSSAWGPSSTGQNPYSVFQIYCCDSKSWRRSPRFPPLLYSECNFELWNRLRVWNRHSCTKKSNNRGTFFLCFEQTLSHLFLQNPVSGRRFTWFFLAGRETFHNCS